MKKITIDTEKLKRLYLLDNYTVSELQKVFSCSKSTIERCLKAINIKKPLSLRLERTQNTLKKQYGVTAYTQTEDYLRKTKETNLSKYGTEYITQSDYFKNKAKSAHIRNLGVENPSQSEKIKELKKNSYIKRYGVDNPMKHKDIRNKAKNTCKEKYGVEYPNQSNKFMNKVYNTRQINGTHRKSIPEDKLYEKIKAKYPDVIRQYTNKEIGLHVDFYIPSIDTYIEYQGYFTHGGHPFDKNNSEDVEKLERWRKKSLELNYKGVPKKQYLDAIRTWTKKDPEKRRIAKENNLNFKEIWSI